MSQVTVWFFLLYIFFPWLETISGKVGLWSPQSCPKPLLFWFASRGLLGTRPTAMVVDHLWDLEACWAAESGSATSVFPGAPQGWPAFTSGLEEVDSAEISGPGWVPGLTLTPRLDRESMVPSGSTIMSITGRVSQGRVSVGIKEHLQKAESTNIITFTCKGNSIIVCWRTQWWKSAPYDVTEGTNISVRLVRTLLWKVCCSYIIP